MAPLSLVSPVVLGVSLATVFIEGHPSGREEGIREGQVHLQPLIKVSVTHVFKALVGNKLDFSKSSWKVKKIN